MVFSKRSDKHGDWLCTDTRRWPMMSWYEETAVTPQYSHQVRQAVLRVESGWDISVIWGSCTYSDNYSHPFGDFRTPDAEPEPFHEEPALVEVALRHPKREHVVGGDVLGWITEEEFARFVDAVMQLPSDWDGDIHAVNGCKRPDEVDTEQVHQGEQA